MRLLAAQLIAPIRLRLRAEYLRKSLPRMDAPRPRTVVRRELRKSVTPLAKDLATSTREQVAHSLGVAASELPVDLDEQAYGFVDGMVSILEGYPIEAAGRVQQAFEEWSSVAEEDRTTDALSTLLDDALDGAEGRLQQSLRLLFGDTFAQMNKTAQMQSGVEGYYWKTVGDAHVRDAHAAMENVDGEKPYSWGDPPLKAGESSNGKDDHPGEDYNCIPGDALVAFNAPATILYRRWISAELTVLQIDPATAIRTTANHPVLTPRGWLPAHLLKVGDYLVDACAQSLGGFVNHPQSSESKASELFRAAASISIVERIAGRATWFNGDGSDEQVDVIKFDRDLFRYCVTTLAQGGSEDGLAWATELATRLGFSSTCLQALLAAAHGVVRSFAPQRALLGGGIRHSLLHSRATLSSLNTVFAQYASDRQTALAQAHAPSDLQLANAIAVQTNDFVFRKIQSVIRVPFSGWVYDFATVTGWFACHAAIIHNCRCVAVPAEKAPSAAEEGASESE